jgi:hypothetical protein
MNRAAIARWEQCFEGAAARVAAAAPKRIADLYVPRLVANVVASFTMPEVLRAVSQVYKANPGQVTRALYLSIKTGLMPGGPSPDVVLVVRHPGGRNSDAPPILDYIITARGVQTLAYESARCLVTGHVVLSDDDFSCRFGTSPELFHRPTLKSRDGAEWDHLRGAYALIRRPEEVHPDFLLLTLDELDKRRRCAGSSMAWRDWPYQMAMKSTVLESFRRGYVQERDEVRHSGTNDWRVCAAVVDGYAQPEPEGVELPEPPAEAPVIMCSQCGAHECDCEPEEEV